jgi:hypothetical protein
MNGVDIADLIASVAEDRRLCRMAGISSADANWPLYAQMVDLIGRMKERGHNGHASTAAAYRLYDVLERPDDETLQ